MTPPALFFFGDSHVGAIQLGAELLGIPCAGRATMRGRLWDENRFELLEDGQLELSDEVGRTRLAESLAQAGARTLNDVSIPMVTTVPFLMDIALKALAVQHTTDRHDASKIFMSDRFFRSIVLDRRAKVFDLIRSLQVPHREIIVVTPPPRSRPLDLAIAFESVILDEMKEMGIRTHRTRDWAVGSDGFLQKQFVRETETDLVHGNAYYGAHVMHRLAPMLGLDQPNHADLLARLADPEFLRAQSEAMSPRHGTAAPTT